MCQRCMCSILFEGKFVFRTASVQALSDVQLWVLDRCVFQMITMRLGMERHAQLMAFLSKVCLCSMIL